jgi:uncharacterized protein (DUF58 family)
VIGRLLKSRRKGAGAATTPEVQAALATGLVSEDLLRRIERLSLRVRRPLPGGPAGEHLGRGSSASVEFSDHRAYTPGDDFRRIDWNALARLDELTIRVTEAREDVGLYILLDCSTSMTAADGAKARLARQLAAGLGYLALNQLDVVKVYAAGDGMIAGSPRYTGRKQGADIFKLLRTLPSVPATNLGTALAAFLADRPTQGLLVVLSDLLTSTDYRTGLRRAVQAGFEVAVVHILGQAELNPRLVGDVELIDAETAEAIKISMTLDTLSQYRKDLDRWRQEIVDYCRSIGVRYVPVEAERSLDAILLGDLRRYGLLQ